MFLGACRWAFGCWPQFKRHRAIRCSCLVSACSATAAVASFGRLLARASQSRSCGRLPLLSLARDRLFNCFPHCTVEPSKTSALLVPFAKHLQLLPPPDQIHLPDLSGLEDEGHIEMQGREILIGDARRLKNIRQRSIVGYPDLHHSSGQADRCTFTNERSQLYR